MKRIYEHLNFGLAYAAVRHMPLAQMLKDRYREDFFQTLYEAILTESPALMAGGRTGHAIHEFSKAIRRDIEQFGKAMGFHRVHVRSVDGVCDRKSNKRAWVQDAKFFSEVTEPVSFRREVAK